MKPDFGEVIARGIVNGVLGVLSQPLVIVTLVVVVGIWLLTRRQRRARSWGTRPRDPRRRPGKPN